MLTMAITDVAITFALPVPIILLPPHFSYVRVKTTHPSKHNDLIPVRLYVCGLQPNDVLKN